MEASSKKLLQLTMELFSLSTNFQKRMIRNLFSTANLGMNSGSAFECSVDFVGPEKPVYPAV